MSEETKHTTEMQALFEAVLNSLPFGLYVINTDIINILGPQKVGEILTERPVDYGFYLPDQKTLWPADQLPLQRLRRDGKANGGIMFIRNKFKPEGIWITNFAYPLRDTHGTIIGGVAIIREIELAAERGLPAWGHNVPPVPLGQ
jgi:PAS domain-containing protein